MSEYLRASIEVIVIISVSNGLINVAFAPSKVSLLINSSCSVLNKYVIPLF